MVTVTLLKTVAPTDTSSVMDRSAGSASAGDAIVGYRAFVAVVVAAYFTFIALTPRQPWMPVVSWVQLLPLSALYLALGIWGFDYARRRSRLPVSLAYLLIEFAIGMRINDLAIGRRPSADPAAARRTGSSPAAACARGSDVRARDRRRQRQFVLVPRVAGLASQYRPGHERPSSSSSCTSAWRSESARHGRRRRRCPLKSRSSPPRTNAIGWRVRFTTPSATI